MTNTRRRKYDGKKLGWLRQGKELILFIFLAFLVFRFMIGVSVVEGNSMEPTLQEGDLVGYLRIVPSYKRGDIVSVRMPAGDYYVKRVIAVGPDTIDIFGGSVYVNGERLEEPYLYEEVTRYSQEKFSYPLTLKEGQLFVMGDNRQVSVDSRTFGPIASTQVRGRVLLTGG